MQKLFALGTTVLKTWILYTSPGSILFSFLIATCFTFHQSHSRLLLPGGLLYQEAPICLQYCLRYPLYTNKATLGLAVAWLLSNLEPTFCRRSQGSLPLCLESAW